MGGGRRKNARRKKAAPASKVDAVPDELLMMVFQRLTSPLDLVRAAFTCRRWRHVIAADGFRVLGSLHGAPSSHVAGHYRVDKRLDFLRPPGRKPVFVPSSSSSPWAGIVAARNLALDFLPRTTEFGELISWELTDVRGGLLLLVRFGNTAPREYDCASLSHLVAVVVCDPLARLYRVVPPSAWFRGCCCLGAFLLNGEDDGGAGISLSNFRVTWVLYGNGVAKVCAFSSAAGGRWTSGSKVICGDDYWTATATGLVSFAGSTQGSAYWTVGVGRRVLALDKEAAELSLSVSPDALQAGEREYAYELPWPPTIRAAALP